MKKAPNVIKKNIAPFTPTGDINDALFSMYARVASFDWLIQDNKDFEDILVAEDYFLISLWNQGSWFTNEQAHRCSQQMIKADGRTKNLVYTIIDENEVVWDTTSLDGAEDMDVTNERKKNDDQVKDPEELRKLEELDDPHKLWKVKKRMIHQIMKKAGWFDEEDKRLRKSRWNSLSEYQLEWIERVRQMSEKFLKQKLQNAIEFEKLCNG